MECDRDDFLIGDFFKKHEGGRIFFGEKVNGGEIVHISEVDRGLSCACVCPECGERLIAKKGKAKKQIYHFAHEANARDRDCYSPGETALHKLAKAVIEKRRKISLPEVSLKRGEFKVIKSPAFDINVDCVSLEKRVGRIIPDVICEHRGTRFFVEFAVTHFCDDQKISYLKDIGISTIEINLSAFKDKKVKNIENLILHDAPREWLWNRKYDVMSRELENKLAEKRMTEIKFLVQTFLTRIDNELFESFDFERWINERATLHGLDVISFLNNGSTWYNYLWLGVSNLNSKYSQELPKIPDDMMGLPIYEAFMNKIDAAKKKLEAAERTKRAIQEAAENARSAAIVAAERAKREAFEIAERAKKEALETAKRMRREAEERHEDRVDQRMKWFNSEARKFRNKRVNTWKMMPNPELDYMTPYQAVRDSEKKFEQAVELMRVKFCSPSLNTISKSS